MELSKEETIEILKLYWHSLSRKVKPKSSEDNIWKNIEAKLLNKSKEKKMSMLFIILYLLVMFGLGIGFLILGFLFGIFLNLCIH